VRKVYTTTIFHSVVQNVTKFLVLYCLNSYNNDCEIWHPKCTLTETEMASRTRHFFSILFLAACMHAQTGATRKSAKDSLTGCLDERDGQYVLTNDTNLQTVARLQPEAGSADDNFAKHMGHKVTVRGKVSREDNPPVMTVQIVTSVSDTCTAAPGTH
jgi:hypothetical protein